MADFSNNNIHIRTIDHQTAEYWSMVLLRDQVLRRPLGLQFTPEQLAEEAEQYLVVAYDSVGNLVACLILKKSDDTNSLQMRQVTVAPHCQQQGIGKQLILWVEKWSKEQAYNHIFCHARSVARVFYEQLGYAVVGKPFTEVGIEHYYMEKQL